MKAKEYLLTIKHMDAQLDSDIEELATLEALATKASVTTEGERVNSSGNQQRMEEVVCKIVMLKEKIAVEMGCLIDCKDKARQLVHESCSDDCIRLISKRYLGIYDSQKGRTVYKTWEQIAVDMGCSYQWVSGKLHKKALAQLQVALDAGEKHG